MVKTETNISLGNSTVKLGFVLDNEIILYPSTNEEFDQLCKDVTYSVQKIGNSLITKLIKRDVN